MSWFKHYVTAHDDDKCKLLLVEFGMAGYGRWWMICELLAGASSHKIPFKSDRDARVIAQALWFSDWQECKEFVGFLIEIKLLYLDADGYVASRRMDDNAWYFGAQRAKGAAGGRRKKAKAEAQQDDG